MTEAEWNRSDDAGAMLEFLWQRRGVSPDEIDLRFGGDVKAPDAGEDLTRSLHQFYLASGRRILERAAEPGDASPNFSMLRRSLQRATEFPDGLKSPGTPHIFP